MFNFNSISADATFSYFKSSLEAMQDEADHALIVGELKKAVKQIQAQEGYYSVKFKRQIPSRINPTHFWSIMETKARQPQKYLPFVSFCEVTDEKRIGKVKYFVRRPNREFDELVWVDEISRIVLFYFNHQGKNFLASNELKQKKDGNDYFICRYIVSKGDIKSSEAFQEYMNEVFEKMIKL